MPVVPDLGNEEQLLPLGEPFFQSMLQRLAYLGLILIDRGAVDEPVALANSP